MADKLMRAQVTIPLDSGVPEDAIVNTFYFDADDFVGRTDDWVHDGIMSLLTDYLGVVDGIYPSTVASPAVVRLYDMRDPEPRVPEFTGTIALTPSADGPLPSEVALVLSFHADIASGEIAARKRGRIFLGPIKTPNAEEVVGSQNRPTAAILNQVAAAGEVLLAGYNTGAPADSSIRWAIYSPKTDVLSSIDDAFNDVVAGYVDDSWDTQRRRGAAPTRRELFDDSTAH